MDDVRTFNPKKKGLGKGLGALIPLAEPIKTEKRLFFYAGIEEVKPNPFQPRKKVREASIDQLAESIKEKGIIQPLLVRKTGEGYELIAGERRWRAAQRAGLTEVPVILKETEPVAQLELALIENIQRQDLNAMEEAEAYQRLIQEFGLSQEEVGRRVGKDRSSIANFLRLLKLPPRVRENIAEGLLSFGHAKCLLGLESVQEQVALAGLVVEKGVSVRELEKIIKKSGKAPAERGRLTASMDEDWIKEMIQRYKTRIKLRRKKKGGVMEIYFHSEEELIGIVDLMMPR